MSSSGSVNNTAPSRSVPSGRIVTGSSNYRPNIHLRWLYGWFGCLRADRPVMAGQRARMPAHRALRAFPARRPERYRREAGQQPACTGNPFRGR